MAPLGWSGGSQFSSTVPPVGAPILVRRRGSVGAEGNTVERHCSILNITYIKRYFRDTELNEAAMKSSNIYFPLQKSLPVYTHYCN